MSKQIFVLVANYLWYVRYRSAEKALVTVNCYCCGSILYDKIAIWGGPGLFGEHNHPYSVSASMYNMLAINVYEIVHYDIKT